MDDPAKSGGIGELALLADIEAISAQYLSEFGLPLINLSNWDPSSGLKARLGLAMPQMRSLSAIDYLFSYTQPDRKKILRTIGYDPDLWGSLLTHSGSSAIVAAAHRLKLSGCQRVVIVGPRYFTVPYALEAIGVTTRTLHCKRDASGYRLPDNLEELVGVDDAVWITNPIYCTGCAYNGSDLGRLHNLMASGSFLVLDECLSSAAQQIGTKFPPDQHLIAIYAPHKSICVNGIKFALIAFPLLWQDAFDAWSDVWQGCLPMSSALAIQHFLGSNFKFYAESFRQECAAAHMHLKNIISSCPSLSLDEHTTGYLVSVFAPRLSALVGLDASFLQRAAHASGAIFIAGLRNELDPSAGLSFRVNLAALDASALGALHRLCFFLEREGRARGTGSITRISFN